MNNTKHILTFVFLTVLLITLSSKDKVLEFQGQLTANGQYAPQDYHYSLLGLRYIPQLNINVTNNDSIHYWDFEISADLSTYYSFINKEQQNLPKPSNSYYGEAINGHHKIVGKVAPYRFWARYRYENLELRFGLQKIDFGSASLLRPLQWFNSMDPRDPLGITNGVFGLLGKYYFDNNANIWMWCLGLNDDQRGFDVLVSDEFKPEFGGRFQYPVPLGELAFTYNHRWANAQPLPSNSIQEDKFALDGKWDVGVGLWFETTYSFLHQPFDMLTNQFAFNFGLDYTFGVGNGLSASLEHLLLSYDKTAFAMKNIQNTTALQLAYPIAMFDTFSFMAYHNWESKSFSAFLSYMHVFKEVSLYSNLYYNPMKNVEVFSADDSSLMMGRGFGVQLMLVFNH